MRVPLIILMMSFCATQIKFTYANKDGFNIYKDLLRGKTDEDEAAYVEANIRSPSKVVYFYRTPAQFGGNGGPLEDPNLGKRTLNKFKNYMLTKETQMEDPHLSDKRSRSMGLPWLKNEYFNIHCDQGKGECWWQNAISDENVK